MNLKRKSRVFAGFVLATVLAGSNLLAQDTVKSSMPSEVKSPRIHVVYFGGNDCPPCVAFRGLEFPKLEKTTAFSKIEWTFVTKTIRSPVPSAFFLPEKIKPMREMLMEATGGRGGSAQVIILVDGKVFDAFFGARDAVFYEAIILSVTEGKPYPQERCLQYANDANRTCLKRS